MLKERKMSSRKFNVSGLLGALFFGLFSNSSFAGEVNAAVAANFTAPMQQIAELFQKESGHTVKLSFGSSGKFYSQIKEGAPFDVILAADEVIPQRLEQEGFAAGGSSFVYAQGKLVLWSAQPGMIDAKGAVLGKGNFNKLAYADPKLAPYGMAAKETLENLGLWGRLQGKLVTGENISQTYQFAATGNAELGFVALSQVYKDGKVTEGSWWQVPSNLYKPIKQSAVQLFSAKDPAAAKAFLTFLKGKKAAEIIRRFGYELP
jgi:molybdate transport system substrate-binding protein